MRIAIMADIHSNHVALEACVEEARRRGAEEFLFLGDYLGELAYPEITTGLLDQLRKEFPCTFIRGNKENYWIDRQKGLNPDWIWEAGSSSTGMLQYAYSRLDDSRIRWFEQMPIAKIHAQRAYRNQSRCGGHSAAQRRKNTVYDAVGHGWKMGRRICHPFI